MYILNICKISCCVSMVSETQQEIDEVRYVVCLSLYDIAVTSMESVVKLYMLLRFFL